MFNLRAIAGRIINWLTSVSRALTRSMSDNRWLIGIDIDERAEQTILRMCNHPYWGDIEPVLVGRYETTPRKYGAVDLLVIDIHTPYGMIRQEVNFIVPRKLLVFQLDWEGSKDELVYSLLNENDGRRYRYREGIRD